MIIRWYFGGVVAAAALGFVAAKCHAAGIAPVGLISIATGGGLGFTLSRWAAVNGIAGRRRLVVGAILVGLTAVFFEHAWLYVDFRRQWREARAADPQVALFRPEEPWTPSARAVRLPGRRRRRVAPAHRQSLLRDELPCARAGEPRQEHGLDRLDASSLMERARRRRATTPCSIPSMPPS